MSWAIDKESIRRPQNRFTFIQSLIGVRPLPLASGAAAPHSLPRRTGHHLPHHQNPFWAWSQHCAQRRICGAQRQPFFHAYRSSRRVQPLGEESPSSRAEVRNFVSMARVLMPVELPITGLAATAITGRNDVFRAMIRWEPPFRPNRGGLCRAGFCGAPCRGRRWARAPSGGGRRPFRPRIRWGRCRQRCVPSR